MCPNPRKFIGFGAMDVSKPFKFIGVGAMEVYEMYRFLALAPGLRRALGVSPRLSVAVPEASGNQRQPRQKTKKPKNIDQAA